MVRRRLSLVLTALLAGLFGVAGPGCGLPRDPADPGPIPAAAGGVATPTLAPSATPLATRTAAPTAAPSPTPSPGSVDGMLRGMALEDKVGQMLIFGLPGPELDPAARHVVADLRVGGVVLVARNAQSPAQLQALLAQLQALARVPLFTSINHEGGAIVRVQTGVTVFPAPMALGAAHSGQLAYEVGLHSAEELAAMGVNMNLAPVLDVNSEPANPVIGLRSFGARPAEVGELGAQFIRGTQEAGVIAVAKHFPGHGSVAVDSHLALPLVTAPADRLWGVDLEPFRQAIGAGVEAIMSAHLAVPALTGRQDLPATLSPAVMTDLLRGRLAFDGLAITDDLDMKGISARMSQAEAAVQAVEAGSDMVMCVEPGSQDAIYAALLQAVRSGRLPEARIDESVRRILSLKARHGLSQAAPRSLAAVGSAEHQALARRACAEAITVASAQGLPLAPERRTLVLSPQVLPAAEGGTVFGAEVRRRAPASRELLYDPYSPAGEAQVQAEALAGEFDQFVVGLWDARLRGDGAPSTLLRELAATGKPVIAVAFGLPYDLGDVPAGVGAVATYGAAPPELLQAAAAVLFGERGATGELPVPLR